MKKLRVFKGAAIAAALFAATGAAAESATNAPIGATGLKQSVNAADIVSILGGLSIETKILPYDGGEAATIAATTSGGGRFLVSLFGCADPAAGLDCVGSATYTAYSNAGIGYETINRFNTDAIIAKAINVSDQNVLIFGAQQFFEGGVSLDNVEFGLLLFLTDIQNFLDGTTWTAREVSATASPGAAGKADNLTASARRDFTAAGVSVVYSPDAAIGAAVANTSLSRFLSDD